jgi:hypothetical protein
MAIVISLHFKIDEQTGEVIDDRSGARYAPADTDTKILIYEDRVNGWFMRIADELQARDGDAGYVALQIAASQIEGIQQHFDGADSKNASKKTFKAGCLRIFGLDAQQHDAAMEKLYDAIRNGLFHDGFTKSKVWLSGEFPNALGFQGDEILVNPWRFKEVVGASFGDYVAKLKDPGNAALRNNFVKIWDAKNR